MEEVTEPTPGYLFRLLIATLCCLWLWMFMPTLTDLGLLYSPNTLIPLFVGMAIVQSFRSKILSFAAALVGSVVYMVHYFTPSNVTGLRSVQNFLMSDWGSMVRVLHGKIPSEPIQTHFFILLLFTLYWLIVYSSLKKRLWCFYNALAIVVLCVVDANTTVHPNEAITVNVLIFFMVLGLRRYVELRAIVETPKYSLVKFFTPLALLIAVSGGVGYLMPKPSAVLGNPIRWLKHPIYGQMRQQSIGFQANNSHLGGSFVMNNHPVMTVIEPYPTYFRGDVFSVYTGQGWQEPNTSLMAHFSAAVPSGALTSYSVIRSRLTTQKITMLTNGLNSDGVQFGGYALKSIRLTTHPNKGANYSINLATGVIRGPKIGAGDAYDVMSAEPESPLSILRSQLPLPPHPEDLYPAAILPFLELPPNLPKRVGHLATQIAGGADSELAIVDRIQQYLQSHYRYETQGIPVPAKGQDYVDQFLFESHKGYCNNFSSSMAVMLRTMGIPSRWVVGFATGQRDFSYVGNESRYIVRNSDAHSWVEVFFPGVGWVPFDPTPNFSMPFAPEPVQSPSAVNHSTTTPGQDIGTVSRYLHKDFEHQTPQTPQSPPQQPSTPAARITHPAGTATTMRWVVYMLAALLAGACFGLWMFRRKLAVKRLSKVWERGQEGSVTQAVAVLLRLLKKKQTLQQRGLTLRDLRIVAYRYGVSDADYLHFVQCAERVWYGVDSSHLNDEDFERLRATWQQWITNILEEKRHGNRLAVPSKVKADM